MTEASQESCLPLAARQQHFHLSVPSWGEGHIHFVKSAFKQEPVSLNSTCLSCPFRTNTLLQSGRQLVTHREPAALSVQTLQMALSSQTFRTHEPDL